MIRHAGAIGFLGGTFDPPHLGHLTLAHAARTALALAEVRLVPAAAPWQKSSISPAGARADMVALAIASEPGLVLDRTELLRGGPSYTVDTLRQLRAALGNDACVVWIIGGDQMARLDTWVQWQHLLDFCHLAVARRNDAPLALSESQRAFYVRHRAEPAAALRRPHGQLLEVPMPPVDVAATTLRALLARCAETLNSDERSMLARALKPQVLDYIGRHSLYCAAAARNQG